MAKLAVPSIPPLSSITDPNTRAVLQAIVDGQRIRNGDVGDGNEKFLTVSDLINGLNGTNGAGGVGSSGADGKHGSKALEAVFAAARKISDEILQSRAWKLLDERIADLEPIARMALPAWFDGKFGTAILPEQEIRKSATEALARDAITTTAILNGNIAGAKREILSYVTDNYATAQSVIDLGVTFNGNIALAKKELLAEVGKNYATSKSVTELEAEFGGNLAQAKTDLLTTVSTTYATSKSVMDWASTFNGKLAQAKQDMTTYVDSTGTVARAVTTLQADMYGTAGAKAKAQQSLEIATSVDGTVRGTKVMKFDINGYVCGTAFTVDQASGKPPISAFVIRADTFAVGAPGAQDVVPFYIQGGKTFINSALIPDASIGNAKIGVAAIASANIADLTVGTLKLANGAVSVSGGSSGGYSAVVWLSSDIATNYMVIGTFTQGPGRHGLAWDLMVDGVICQRGTPAEDTEGAMSRLVYLAAGVHQFAINAPDAKGGASCGIAVVGVKR